jgi:prevent-host-death family protein
MTRISVTDAKSQLTDLVRRAEAGEEIVLTRHGQDVASIAPVRRDLTPAELSEKRRKALDKLDADLAAHPPSPGPDAAHSADFLYGPDGMPK